MKTLSPLRYPGGKSRAIEIVFDIIPSNTKELVSPFFGGGSIELYCASKGIKVYGYDIFDPLVDFWKSITKNPKALAEEIELYNPLSKDMFYFLQKKQSSFKSQLERAAVFFVLNRSSFSGSTLSGGMSPDHPRFNKASINKVASFKVKNFTVEKLDFEQSINNHPNTRLYLDPPYLIDNFLYGKQGNTHKGFDHQKLCDMLKKRDNWILSYNDCTTIADMYKDYKILYPTWQYGMSSNKKSKEVLILSKDIERLYNGKETTR